MLSYVIFLNSGPTSSEINKLLESGDIREVATGCLANLELIKAFEYVTAHSEVKLIP
jgi:hypothetical protein